LSFGSEQSVVISLVEWKESFLKEDYFFKYEMQIFTKLQLMFTKHLHTF